MDPTRLMWPARYRRIFVALGLAGTVLALLRLATGAAWFSIPVLFGLVLALFALSIVRHMTTRPMLAVEGGELLCRLEGATSGRADLRRVHRFPIASVDAVERTIRPWPGGERHYYRLHMLSGRVHGLVPRPADAETRRAMAAFFDFHFPGRVRETR